LHKLFIVDFSEYLTDPTSKIAKDKDFAKLVTEGIVNSPLALNKFIAKFSGNIYYWFIFIS
jgi:hypothetical protein